MTDDTDLSAILGQISELRKLLEPLVKVKEA